MPAKPRRLRVLLTNDDGILSPGLLALRSRLSRLADVEVVAPDAQRSGTSHAVTLHTPLYAEEVVHRGERIGMSVTGTPADCVKYALTEHLSSRPDLVISGINLGTNLGVSVFYSGTVGAAMEAAFFGIPAIAFSTEMNDDDEIDCLPLADIAGGILERFREPVRSGQRFVLNVNFPALPPASFKGLRITRQGLANFQDRFERRRSEDGRDGLWLVGDLGKEETDGLDVDVNAVRAGFISVTPLKQDLTHHDLLQQLKGL